MHLVKHVKITINLFLFITKGAVSQNGIKLVTTFDEEKMLSAEPVSKEQQSLIDKVFKDMHGELKNEKISLLNAKNNQS
jgi:hypothetical protein